MKHSILITVILIPCFLSVSCSMVFNKSINNKLAEIEHNIITAPDSSYNELMKIDRNRLHSSRQRARHALLSLLAADLSDQSRIDDSTANVALGYYRFWGTQENKMKAFYCKGISQAILGNENLAMANFIKAEKYDVNDFYKACLYYEEASLYERSFAYTQASRLYTLAAEHFLKYGHIEFNAESLIGKASCLFASGDSASFYNCIKDVYKNYPVLPATDKFKILDLLDEMKGKTAQTDELEKMFALLHNSSEDFSEYGLDLSRRYLEIGMTDSAETCLEKYAHCNPKYTHNPDYYLCLSELQLTKNEPYSALNTYRKYSELKDSANIDRIYENIQSVASQHKEDLRKFRTNIALSILCLGIVAAIASTIKIGINYRKKYKIQQAQIDSIPEEFVPVDKACRESIDNQVAEMTDILINSLFNKTDSPSSISDILTDISSDKKANLHSLGSLFSIRYSSFATYLKKHGLSTWEIGFVSLYCLGYRGKEVGSVLGSSKYYKINSSIRKKLGLSRKDTNLDIYVRNLKSKILAENK